MSRSPAEWTRIIDRAKSTHDFAETIIGDLLGYRKTALSRAEDTDNLTFALEAMQLVARRTSADAAAALQQVKDALAKYGCHHTTCAVVQPRTWPYTTPACTCGLAEVMGQL